MVGKNRNKNKICGECKEEVIGAHWSRHWRRNHEGIPPYVAREAPVQTNELDDMAGFGQQPILTP